MLTNALFSFCHFYRERFAPLSARYHVSEIRFCGTTPEYRIGTKNLVTVTFLLFSVSSCPKVTGVPSPTISMVQRTALRLLVNSLHKQITIICLRFRQISGLFTYWLGSVFKRSSPVVFHLGDLLFWAEYYRTAQDVGLLTIAVGQRRPVWIQPNLLCTRQNLSQTSRGFTSQVYSAILNWRLLIETYTSWSSWLWSRVLLQRMTSSRLGKPEKEFKRELPNDQKLVLL